MSDAFKIFGNPPDREHEDGEHGETMGRPAVRTPLDLAAARAKLAQAGGRYFWKSLEELAGTPEAEAFEHHEFPYDPEKDARKEGIGRRDILKLMAASAALSGLSACTKLPVEKIVPYVRPPEEIIPGKPLFYATSMPTGNGAIGLLVESNMGRPTKIEGNSVHPASLGATNITAQASVLTLYDPDRSPVVVREGRISDWAAFLTALGNVRGDWEEKKGGGLRILTDGSTSPTLAAQMRALLEKYPNAKWYAHEPYGPYNQREGAKLAFGRNVNSVYHFDQADVIASLDADFLYDGATSVRYAREFADRRRIENAQSNMNRLYVVESTPTNTGAMADHRLALRASEVGGFARALAAALGLEGYAGAETKVPATWLAALARDMQKHRGASLVLAGDAQPPAVHALAHAMNQALGNAGKTVEFTEPIEVSPEMDGLAELAKEMEAGEVTTLVILGSNPAYTAASDLEFPAKLLKVGLRIHSGLYNDETAELCHWHIPEAHYLESWSDARAYDGTVGIVQPLIAPLYDGKSAHEMIAAIAGVNGKTGHDLVRDYWKTQRPAKETDKAFEDFWETTLHDGVMANTALPARAISANVDAAKLPATKRSANANALEVVFRADPTIGDGRDANNGWLQELPKPLTKLTWDNTVIVSPATAERLGVTNSDVVTLFLGERALNGPIWIMPGHANDSVTIHLGYGRRRAGHLGTGIGFNAYSIRTSEAPWIASGVRVEKTGRTLELATTQHHQTIERGGREIEEESSAAEARDILRVGTLDEFRKKPDFAADSEEITKVVSLYPPYKYDGYAWGMSVDLNSCTGCGACVLACQSENNIAVVGKEEVIAGRQMQWIRVDNYFRGDLDNPESYYQPVLCQHCENAPCELVCPVGATMHSDEGLNEMIYNRCVGTRYCSNNCPYKVRRFNFKLFSDWTTPSLFGLRNPNVTVRSRGVMEKCTYCVQRINAAKIQSEEENRQVRDGEIVTACEAVCPSRALIFGNINDPNSQVAKLKAQTRNYSLLGELNTRPRTTYLAKLRNPNPEIAEA
ncbi:MAG: TAT-variant-translocated molybdopterin oxidoreductase [Candidatus Acidiferrales bacterium]